VLKLWLEEFRADFENNEVLSFKLLEIVDGLNQNGMELMAASIKRQLSTVRETLANLTRYQRPPASLVFTEETPKPITPKTLEFLDFNPTEFARQMTLIEFNLYKGNFAI
jgi:hypothetical protein